MTDDMPLQPRHPIRVVSQRTALSTEVLRAWERRYGVVEPGRTDTGQRLYSDADVERLRLLRLATQFGRSIGQVAELSTRDLADLVREDEAARNTRDEIRLHEEATASPTRIHLRAAEGAVVDLDAKRLEAVLMRALVALSAEQFVDDVAVPLLRMLGSRWAEGTLGVAHEHMASAVLRRVLGFMADSADAAPGAPMIVTATPAGQVHEFGALLAAATAGSQGWRVLYLGADLPARDIASAVRLSGARAVALSVVIRSEESILADALRTVREGVGAEVALLVGGAAAADHAPLLDQIGARVLCGLPEMRTVLRELARSHTNIANGSAPSGGARGEA